MEKNLEVLTLFDLYGGLLTQKQKEAIIQYFECDLSLGEIGQNLGISRQAVKDSIDSAIKSLNEFDSQLKLSQIRSQLIIAQTQKKSQMKSTISNILDLIGTTK